MALKLVEGSRQLLQRHSALHEVEPNSDSTSVSPEPHCGHATCSTPNSARRELPASGGAMPYSRSLRRPSSLTQSVVQAGDSTVRTFEWRKPSRSSASSISSAIMFIAGQPE